MTPTNPFKPVSLLAVMILAALCSHAVFAVGSEGLGTNQVTIKGRAFVIDGDTVVIGKSHVRLQGIDAPEYKQTCQKPDGSLWPCGLTAARQLRQKLEGAAIVCTGYQWDKYGRLLANCYLAETNLNRWMVASGWAIAYRFFTPEFAKEEDAAKATRIGIWDSKFIEPYQWRQSHPQK